jgi:hypothetical protein
MLMPHGAHDAGAFGRHHGVNMADRWWESQRFLNEIDRRTRTFGLRL